MYMNDDEYFDEFEEEFEEGWRMEHCREGDGGKPIGVRNKELGARGESAAARYLRLCGYEILERNWECPAGEADIIARDGDTLVFVEVKTRTSFKKGFPSEAVGPKKRARYEKIAIWYLREYDEVDIHVRFDVIAIVVIAEDRGLIKHYVDAFGVVR